ncbi:hypothetical protein Nepgr_009840 [Nepenthes gracilis]|uniref:Uncharacterized protein n=1 Tax=Nepenthes gracilis TaxID=150966 RepID=A0AAD3SB69_NEPGR|nr:hypothetical protein Nepgr_009840 [Nepenthes gracilis]
MIVEEKELKAKGKMELMLAKEPIRSLPGGKPPFGSTMFSGSSSTSFGGHMDWFGFDQRNLVLSPLKMIKPDHRLLEFSHIDCNFGERLTPIDFHRIVNNKCSQINQGFQCNGLKFLAGDSSSFGESSKISVEQRSWERNLEIDQRLQKNDLIENHEMAAKEQQSSGRNEI